MDLVPARQPKASRSQSVKVSDNDREDSDRPFPKVDRVENVARSPDIKGID